MMFSVGKVHYCLQNTIKNTWGQKKIQIAQPTPNNEIIT